MAIFLELSNRTDEKVPLRRFFVSAASRAFAKASLRRAMPKKLEISLVFVSSLEMRKLNRACRGVDAPTDVLSFPRFQPLHRPRRQNGALGRIFPVADPDGVVRLGELVIAPSVSKKEADAFGHAAREHIVFLFIHGLLHLLGYDHERSGAEERFMWRIQQEALAAR